MTDPTQSCAWDGCEHPALPLRRTGATTSGGLGLCEACDRTLTSRVHARQQFNSNARADHADAREQIYAALCGGEVKIGKSVHPQTRVKNLGATSFTVVPTGETEGDLQFRFWDYHTHGEYFRYEGACKDWYDSMQAEVFAATYRIRRGHAMRTLAGMVVALCGDSRRQRLRADPDRPGDLSDVTCRKCRAAAVWTPRAAILEALVTA